MSRTGKTSKTATKQGKLRLAAWLILGLVVISLAHLWFIRPWYMRWGATPDEIGKTCPGDEFTPHSASQATRAVTINAPVSEVWPWIVQVGQDRAGFYSYTWLENLFRADMHNAGWIHQEWQTRKVGDTVWLARKDRYAGQARVIVAALDPGRAMVLVSPEDAERISRGGCADGGTWTFIIDPINGHATRLILRSRGPQDESFLTMLFRRFVFDPAHFIMERKMMLSIKKHVETGGSA